MVRPAKSNTHEEKGFLPDWVCHEERQKVSEWHQMDRNKKTSQEAVLALEDGSVFRGRSFGGKATVVGEAVFNTSMTGYQEILTDPSYYGQIVTMTAPQIGNYGIIPGDNESDSPKVAGFVVRELSPIVSNWRARETLDEFLSKHGIPGIEGVDTRAITKRIRIEQVRSKGPDAVFLSNGPGDPAAVTYAHETVRDLLPDFPVFGICLGHQIITHALGASTYKLKFGHRGGNQPVKNMEAGRVAITAQNHGFAASVDDLEENEAIVTEYNLNDNTVSGLRHKELPVFSVQYHPEAAPGPNDATDLFQAFHDLITDAKAKKRQ